MALTKVRYKGLSDVRTMTKKELADQQGITVDTGFTWDRSNAWTQIVDSPSDAFLDMLKRDGNFTVTDAEADDEAHVIMSADPAKADDTGKTVVDKNEAKAVENKTASKGK